MGSRFWRWVRTPIRKNILHLDDTPHRIAWGVFLGFVVGWSPTMGAQIVIYWLLAMLLRANRVSGVLPVLLTNPITAMPVYVFNWKIGRVLLHFGDELGAASTAAREAELLAFLNEYGLWRVFDGAFWSEFWPIFRGIGLELVVGCLVVGGICGAIGYVATYYGVIAYRRRRQTTPLGTAA